MSDARTEAYAQEWDALIALYLAPPEARDKLRLALAVARKTVEEEEVIREEERA